MTTETKSLKTSKIACWLALACLGVAALLIGLYLKVVDKKKHLGLEEPNIK